MKAIFGSPSAARSTTLCPNLRALEALADVEGRPEDLAVYVSRPYIDDKLLHLDHATRVT